MQKYRIGKLINPWTNRTPPIRGGVFTNPEESTSDSELSDASTLVAYSTSNDDAVYDSGAKLRHAIIQEVEDVSDCLASSKPLPPAVPQRDAATQALIEKTIRGEVDDNIRDYPSLDTQTQRAIENRYRALHDRVKNEGYYECRYQEYAKELSRYLSIFALFMTALVHGWYWTSAALLGLFWVSNGHRFTYTSTDKSLAPDNVHRPRCWSSRHHSELRQGYTNRGLHCRLLLWALHRLVEE